MAVAALGGEIKKSRASLVGGVAVGFGVLALWTAIAHELGSTDASTILLGGGLASLIAAWIWKADL